MPTPEVIVCTGPESSGKSTLAEGITSARPSIGLIHEYARSYLAGIHSGYTKNDLLKIAELQENAINDAIKQYRLVLADTDVLTILIWMEDKFGERNSHLYDMWQRALGKRIYLLCKPDIPWQPDPLREDPHRRESLFERHIDLLLQYKASFHVVEGSPKTRLQKAMDIMDF